MLKILITSTVVPLFVLASARAANNGSDVLPPLGSPRLHFGSGAASARGIAVFPEIPGIPGEISSWTLVQWRKADPLTPTEFTQKPGENASYDWKSRDGNTELTVSRKGSTYVYDLIGRNGSSDATGESDLGLSADVVPHSVSAAHALIFTINARLSEAAASYETPQAKQSGLVLAQGGINFRASFHDPESHRTYSIQLGIPLINSRNPRPEHVGCHFFGQDRVPQINSEKVSDGKSIFPFVANAEMKALTYRVNDYICDMIAKPVPCRSSDGPHMTMIWPASAFDLNNWSIGSVVISIGTQNGVRQQNGGHPQGDIKVGLEISDPRLLESSQLFSEGRCPRHE